MDFQKITSTGTAIAVVGTGAVVGAMLLSIMLLMS
ncbi:MAG: hypothetical protein CM15mV13_2130 [uncultured marine virus]|nr:MAG: hypothetical protein CM15mV13_2130 [uncultured marine virus]